MASQMNLPHLALHAALAGVLAAGAGPTAAQGLATAQPDDFRAQGPVIQGWHWLRDAGAKARWHWSPVWARPGQACINFSLLVTNRVSGGSGYDATVQVSLIGDDGMSGGTSSVRLLNPFRPVFPGNTRGLGYPAYGAVCPRGLYALMRHGFTLEMRWTLAVGRHIAVRRDSAVLGYVEERPY